MNRRMPIWDGASVSNAATESVGNAADGLSFATALANSVKIFLNTISSLHASYERVEKDAKTSWGTINAYPAWTDLLSNSNDVSLSSDSRMKA